MADYVTSENGIKIPLSKVEAESVKRLSCPYCQKEFHAAAIKFRAELDFDEVALKEAEARKLEEAATGNEEAKMLAEMSYENCKKFQRQKHMKFINAWEKRGWKGLKMCEHSTGYYYEEPDKSLSEDDGAADSVLVDNVKFCVLGSETMNGFVYDDDGYIVGANEIHPGGESFVSRKKMCPECYCLLPSDFGKFPSKILAILGVRGSGKTLYIAHLLSEISERLSEMGFVINASNEAIENFTKRYRARADVSYVGTEVRAYPPLFLNIQKSGQSDWERNLILYDIAGESCVNGKMNQFGSFIWRADGVVLLISPEQIAEHSRENSIEFQGCDLIEYKDNQKPPALDAVVKTIFNIASRRILRRLKKKVPLAVTLSKSDVYTRAFLPGNNGEKKIAANENSQITRNVEYYIPDNFMLKQHVSLEGEVKDIIKSGSLDVILSKFRLKKYFAFSSLGKPLSDIADGGEVAEPVRIEEPIAWIMAEWGWLWFEGKYLKSIIKKIADKFRR